MKKIIVIFSFLLAFSLVFCGCIPRIMAKPDNVMVIPDNDAIGEPQMFEKDGIKILLTDRFIKKRANWVFMHTMCRISAV